MTARRVLGWMGAASALVLLLAASPILVVETACRPPVQPPADARPALMASEDRRPQSNSVLSYPEWAIVYAYRDLAAIDAANGPSSFRYGSSIGGFWTGLCGVNRVATAQGGVSPEEKAMIYIIGLSFSVEMGLKGAWENTIGWVATAWRGPDKTAEDRFDALVAEDYGRFLEQTPWYEYDFAGRRAQLWRDVPFSRTSMVRAVERRVEMTAEWSVKSVYAKILRAAAGLAPADLRIRSAVRGLDDTDPATDPRISRVTDMGDGLSLIETPRYGAFTEVVLGLAGRGRTIKEIAGNRVILVTVLVPDDITLDGDRSVFSEAMQARPGWHRVGVMADVPQLARDIRTWQRQGAVVEHLYDY